MDKVKPLSEMTYWEAHDYFYVNKDKEGLFRFNGQILCFMDFIKLWAASVVKRCDSLLVYQKGEDENEWQCGYSLSEEETESGKKEIARCRGCIRLMRLFSLTEQDIKEAP